MAPLALQYADYAAWQRRELTDAFLAPQFTYWKAKLQGAPAGLALNSRVASRLAARDNRNRTAQRHPITLDRALVDAARDLARTAGATLFMVALAAFKWVLSRAFGTTDIVVGTPIAHRTRPEFEDLVGFFVNTLVLRTHVDGNLSFDDLLERVKDTTLGAYAHQDVPFERLVLALNLERNLASTALFDVLVILQNAPRSPLALPELTWSSVDLPSARRSSPSSST